MSEQPMHWCTCSVPCLYREHRQALCSTCYLCRNLRDEADQKAALAYPGGPVAQGDGDPGI